MSWGWHPLLLVPLALSAWVYHPLLQVNFFADDFVHFVAIESDGILDFLFAPFGGHNYLVRNLFVLAAWKGWGMHAPYYYVLVLGTHLLNVGLLFGVLRALTGSAALACFGATLWGTSPLCLGTVGWFSVYGQVLVATIMLAVLLPLTRAAATDGSPPRAGTSCLWYALLLAGTTCFGVGVGVALVFPLVLFLLLPAVWRRPGLRIAWLLLPPLTLALYFAFRRLYPLIGPLTLAEHLQEYLAVSRFWMFPPMLVQLLGFSIAGSTLGFFLPTGYPSPASWAALAVYLAGMALLLARGTPETRRAALAIGALGVAVYLIIAAGRAAVYVEFKVPLLKAATTARYHYVGSLPVVILFCLMLRELGRVPGFRAVPAPLALAGGLAALTYGVVRVGVTIPEHPETLTYVRSTADEIARAVRAQPPGSTVYVENERTPGLILGVLPNFLFPGRAGVFVMLHPDGELDGRTVRFVERDDTVMAYYHTRPDSRLAHLLVPPGAVPAGS